MISYLHVVGGQVVLGVASVVVILDHNAFLVGAGMPSDPSQQLGRLAAEHGTQDEFYAPSIHRRHGGLLLFFHRDHLRHFGGSLLNSVFI